MLGPVVALLVLERRGPQLLGNSSVATYYGPSFMIDELTYHYEGFDINSVLINCHYPIDRNSFVLQSGIITERSEALPGDEADKMARRLSDFIQLGFEQDIKIWKTKARIDNPLLCEEDGPVYQLRRWYEQFYVDRADVQPEMVDRFEFEVDTTKANEYWQDEVAENLRLKAEEDAAGSPAEGEPSLMSGT